MKGNGPFTEDKFDHARFLYKGGASKQQIMRLMQISETTARRVISCETYKEYKSTTRQKQEMSKEEKQDIQDLHDIAREVMNIKKIVLKIAEAWDIKL